VEDLVSRGHRYQDVIDLYPVGLVLNFHRAARLNRRMLVVDLAIGVSLGIRDALAKEGKLVQNWVAGLEEPAPPGGQAAEPPASSPIVPWLNHLPVITRKRNG
jgi:hypothetical protein